MWDSLERVWDSECAADGFVECALALCDCGWNKMWIECVAGDCLVCVCVSALYCFEWMELNVV